MGEEEGARRSFESDRIEKVALHVYVFLYLLLNSKRKKKHQQLLPHVFCKAFME